MTGTSQAFLRGLDALKSNIVDGQNKIDILASLDLMRSSPTFLGKVRVADEVLEDVGVGLPPKNNPIFGVVKGNPVIFIVDESTSMDASFTLDNDTFMRRKLCNSQL